MVLRHRKHYNKPMDIEWAKDGLNNQHIVQARPETVYGKEKTSSRYTNSRVKDNYHPRNRISDKIASGKAEYFIILKKEINCWKAKSPTLTNPDWDPILKKAAAIITTKVTNQSCGHCGRNWELSL
jgi:pyruvate,water dikinase